MKLSPPRRAASPPGPTASGQAAIEIHHDGVAALPADLVVDEGEVPEVEAQRELARKLSRAALAHQPGQEVAHVAVAFVVHGGQPIDQALQAAAADVGQHHLLDQGDPRQLLRRQRRRALGLVHRAGHHDLRRADEALLGNQHALAAAVVAHEFLAQPPGLVGGALVEGGHAPGNVLQHAQLGQRVVDPLQIKGTQIRHGLDQPLLKRVVARPRSFVSRSP